MKENTLPAKVYSNLVLTKCQIGQLRGNDTIFIYFFPIDHHTKISDQGRGSAWVARLAGNSLIGGLICELLHLWSGPASCIPR